VRWLQLSSPASRLDHRGFKKKKTLRVVSKTDRFKIIFFLLY